jgi:rfaE bifunctional protein nucleotidyltransferase chain/domain
VNLPTTGKIINLVAVANYCQVLRKRENKVVVTNGCYDIIHRGHIALLEQARALGDFLIVAVNSDQAVRQLKGEGRPIVNEQDRAAIIAALHCVDAVVIVDSMRVDQFLRCCGEVLWVKGGDYTIDSLDKTEVEAITRCNGSIRILPFTPGYSTSQLVGRIKG